MRIRSCSPLLLALYCLKIALFPAATQGQSTPQASLPDSPGFVAQLELTSSSSDDPQQPQGTTQQQPNPDPASTEQVGKQTKRIFFIIPNFRAVSANTHLPPQSVKDKFIVATQDSFDYSGIIFSGLLAGYNMATVQTPEFHQGAAGYGRYFWHTFADQTIENYCVEFIVPAIAHEDNRYYTLGHGGFWKRTGYSISRAFVTRKDDGSPTFNSGEIIGAGMAAGISNTYYPSAERTFGNTAQKWGENVGIDAGTFVFKEFWPDINRGLFHNKF